MTTLTLGIALSVTLCMVPFQQVAKAQCSITSILVYENCSNHGDPHVSIHWDGGTAPFTVDLLTGEGYFTQWITDQMETGGAFAHSEFDYSVQATVTDASGCVATEQYQWQNYFPMPPQIMVTEDCAQGSILRWTGQFMTGMTTSQVSSCPGNYTYQLFNSSTNVNGVIATDWVQESSTSWRYVTPLSPGSYMLYIFPQGNPSCDAGLVVQCYEYATFGVAPACGTNFHLRAALSGALPSGTLMNDHLRQAGLVPTNEPYSALGYTYTGSTPGVGISAAMLNTTGNNAIVDWVVVELRDANTPATILFSKAALLQRDGDVIDTDGSTYVHTPLSPGSYHVALRHRNHLPIMTATPRGFTTNPSGNTIDFRSANTATYGINARTAVGSVQCLWAGDATGNGSIMYTGEGNDRDRILQAIGGSSPTNTVANAYSTLDINMNGIIQYTGNGNDRDVILGTIGGMLPTAVRNQQLP